MPRRKLNIFRHVRFDFETIDYYVHVCLYDYWLENIYFLAISYGVC